MPLSLTVRLDHCEREGATQKEFLVSSLFCSFCIPGQTTWNHPSSSTQLPNQNFHPLVRSSLHDMADAPQRLYAEDEPNTAPEIFVQPNLEPDHAYLHKEQSKSPVTDAPLPSSAEAEKIGSPEQHSRWRSWWTWAFIIFIILAIVLGTTLGVVLPKKEDDDSAEASGSTETSSSDPSSTTSQAPESSDDSPDSKVSR